MKKGDKQYKKLLVLESGSEEEEDATENHSDYVPENNENISKNFNSSKKEVFTKAQYLRSRSPYHVTHNKACRCCSPTACAFSFALVLVALGLGYMAGFYTSGYWGKSLISRLEPISEITSKPWRTKFADYGTESCIRLVDADGDGIDDVIIGLAYGKDVTSMVVESTMDAYCEEQGMKTPCAGAVVALRGYDGKLLWKAVTYAEIFELNCNLVDSNRDGVLDCVASGRLGTIYSIDVRTGEILWEGDTEILKRGWNIYSATRLPDFDGDGVNDLIISHGGDPTVAADIHVRRSGWLVALSGATGKSLGRPLVMPEERETYCAPVLHTRKDGSEYVLFGSGGETVGGRFMAISVPDLYHYVTRRSKDRIRGRVKGSYRRWGFAEPGPDGVFTLFLSEPKGVMVPPVLVDMNGDGVDDILMSSFMGTMILYDGETLEVIWRIRIEGAESYSTPSPGYFNDDDVLDFMVHWCHGAWPYYNSTDTIVLDGRDGSIIWNVTSEKYDVSSDLTVRTRDRNRDIFLFRLQGRRGHDAHAHGAIHGATGIQRVVRRRSTEDGAIDLVEQDVLGNPDADLTGLFLTEHHVRRAREEKISDDYIECESDQTVYLAEMFAVDRGSWNAPYKLWQKGSEKFYYQLTPRDEERVHEFLKQYGDNYTVSENEVPWSRGKRSLKDDQFKPYCIVVQPDERTTGAFGDLDGDGKLDVIVNIVSVGIIRDEHAIFVKMKFNTDIFKFSLDDLLSRQVTTRMNASMHERLRFDSIGLSPMTSLKYLPAKHQNWAAYMGTTGDSIFKKYV